EGTRSCVSGALYCSDTSSSTVDLCNGTDDDCDPATADGSLDPMLGSLCDGPDTDLCKEGTRSCVSGALYCSDTSSSTVDLCNGTDDDCNPVTLDGAQDPSVATPCDGSDSDLCKEGSLSCSNGTLVCSDTSSSNLDVCNGADDDCNTMTVDGSQDPM